MPTPYDAELRALRMRYKAALAAHQSWAQQVTAASLNGSKPSQELVDSEAKASRAVAEARANLLAAMAKAPGS